MTTKVLILALALIALSSASKLKSEAQTGGIVNGGKYKIFTQIHRMMNLMYPGGNEVDLRLNGYFWKAQLFYFSGQAYYRIKDYNNNNRFLCIRTDGDVGVCSSTNDDVYFKLNAVGDRYCMVSKDQNRQLYSKVTVRYYFLWTDYDYDIESRSSYNCDTSGQFYFQKW